MQPANRRLREHFGILAPRRCSIACPTEFAHCEHGIRLDRSGCPTGGACECRNPCEDFRCAIADEICVLRAVQCVQPPCPKQPTCKFALAKAASSCASLISTSSLFRSSVALPGAQLAAAKRKKHRSNVSTRRRLRRRRRVSSARNKRRRRGPQNGRLLRGAERALAVATRPLAVAHNRRRRRSRSGRRRAADAKTRHLPAKSDRCIR